MTSFPDTTFPSEPNPVAVAEPPSVALLALGIAAAAGLSARLRTRLRRDTKRTDRDEETS